VATAPRSAEPARQLWLDVDRPILTRPRRPKPLGQDADRPHHSYQQMELRMAPAPKNPKKIATPAATVTRVEPSVARPPSPAPVVIAPSSPAVSEPTQSFSSWLFDQAKRPGLIGELAKAAKLDRQFPKNGSVDDVRARFSAAGADGDAFMALEDAENEYDRL